MGLKLGILAGLAALVAKLMGQRRSADPHAASVSPLRREDWPPLQRDPVLAEPVPSTSLHTDPDAPSAPAGPAPGGAVAWVEPSGDVCPTSHPVKAKLASKIFHVPGGLSYARTKPDRCYRDSGAAEADGLRPAKR